MIRKPARLGRQLFPVVVDIGNEHAISAAERLGILLLKHGTPACGGTGLEDGPQRALGVAHRLHPAGRLVVHQLLLERDALRQCRERFIVPALAIRKLADEHLPRHGDDVVRLVLTDVPVVGNQRRFGLEGVQLQSVSATPAKKLISPKTGSPIESLLLIRGPRFNCKVLRTYCNSRPSESIFR